MVIFANVFEPDGKNRESTRRMIELLNQPFVERVANHLQPAVDSMIDCGLRSDKAVAYDVDLPPRITTVEPKDLKSTKNCELVFAANLVNSKVGAEFLFGFPSLEMVLIAEIWNGSRLSYHRKLSLFTGGSQIAWLGRQCVLPRLSASRRTANSLKACR
jgi:hypothetical protein